MKFTSVGVHPKARTLKNFELNMIDCELGHMTLALSNQKFIPFSSQYGFASRISDGLQLQLQPSFAHKQNIRGRARVNWPHNALYRRYSKDFKF
jgi:hypothetical protein